MRSLFDKFRRLFPIDKLDRDRHQQIWLPVFIVLVWIYTLPASAGALILFLNRKNSASSIKWLILATLLTLPRLDFFAALENPEPRCTVELFAFTAILGGIATAQIRLKRIRQLSAKLKIKNFAVNYQ